MTVLTQEFSGACSSPQIDPSTFNFTHVLKYFRDHVDPQMFVAVRDKVDAMIDKGMSAPQIRQVMEDDEHCPKLFVEAILIGQAKQYVKTNAMIKAGVNPKDIYVHMTKEESGDTELIGAIIEKETGFRVPDATTAISPPLRDRDPRAYRAVSKLVVLDLAMKMKKVGVPEGGIRQKLVRLGTSEDKVNEIMAHVREQAEANLRRRSSAESSKSRQSLNTSVSLEDEEDNEVSTTDDFCDDAEYSDEDDFCSDEDSSTMRLQVAVTRRIQEMTQQGMSKSEIRTELISMKGVNQGMVDSFLTEKT